MRDALMRNASCTDVQCVMYRCATRDEPMPNALGAEHEMAFN